MLCVVAFLWPLQLQAQRRDRMPRFQNLLEHDVKRYHFGFTVGFNSLDFAIQPSEFSNDHFKHVLSEPTSSAGFAGGYHVGIIGNLKLGRFFDLRFIPTYIYSHNRVIEFYGENHPNAPADEQILEINMLQFPLHLKYKSARMNNTRAYVIGGVSYSYDLDAASARTSDTDSRNTPFLVKVAHNDLQYEVGIGLEQYFPLFKGSIELKASFGLMDLLREGTDRQTIYHDAISRMHSRSIMLSFLFEG